MTDVFVEFDARIAAENAKAVPHQESLAKIDKDLAQASAEQISLNTELKTLENAIADAWNTSKTTTSQETRHGQINARLKALEIVVARLAVQRTVTEDDLFNISIAVDEIEAQKALAQSIAADATLNELQQAFNDAQIEAEHLGQVYRGIENRTAYRKEQRRLGNRNA